MAGDSLACWVVISALAGSSQKPRREVYRHLPESFCRYFPEFSVGTCLSFALRRTIPLLEIFWRRGFETWLPSLGESVL